MDGIWAGVRRTAGLKSCGKLFVVFSLATVALADEPPQPANPRVAGLIRDLGSADYGTRERADRQLGELGGETREQLEQALSDPDVEVRLRATRLLDRLRLEDLWRPRWSTCMPRDKRPRRFLLRWPRNRATTFMSAIRTATSPTRRLTSHSRANRTGKRSTTSAAAPATASARTTTCTPPASWSAPALRRSIREHMAVRCAARLPARGAYLSKS